MSGKTHIALPVAITLAFGLVACQTGGDAPPAVSLAEARKVAVELAKTPFKPPPRTINDVLAVLDRHKPNPEKIRFFNVQANREIPDDTSSHIKWRAFFNRAYYADLSGRFEQALKDYRFTLKFMDVSIYDDEWSVPIARLALREAEAGNFQLAQFVLRRAINEYPNHHLTLNVTMARVFAMAGDIEQAEYYANFASDILSSRSEPPAKYRQLELRALIHEMKGEWALAESLRRAVILRASNLSWGRTLTVANYREALHFKLAKNLLHQGRPTEAEVVIRKSIVLLLKEVGKYNIDTVNGLRLLVEILSSKGRYDEAETLSRAILDILDTMRVPADSRFRGMVHHLLGKTLAAKGNWHSAGSAFEKARLGFADNTFFYWRLYGQNLDVSMTLVKTGKADDAVDLLTPTIERRKDQFGNDHYETNEARAVLAMARAAHNDLEGAIELYRRAVPALMARDGGFFTATRKTADRKFRLKTILESYIDVLSRLWEKSQDSDARGRFAAEAFAVVDTAQGGTVLQALGASAARNLAKDPDTGRLLREEQDAALWEEVLEAHLSNALATSEDQTDEGGIRRLQDHLAKVREARKRLRIEIERRLPQYADLVNPRPLSTAEVQELLNGDEALLVVYEGSPRTYVWAIPKTGRVSFAAVELKREGLADTVGLLRESLEPDVQFVGDIPEFDVGLAYELFERLLKPVRAGWQEARNLLVVAQGELGQIPLSLLPTEPPALGPARKPLFSNYRDVRWLARTHATTVLPSAASLRTLRLTHAVRSQQRIFIGFADPWFNREQAQAARRKSAKVSDARAGRPEGELRGFRVGLRASPNTEDVDSAALRRLPRLPETADEIRVIAEVLGANPSTSVFTGAVANEQTVKSMDLSGVRVLAFATHALVSGDLDGLNEPALALSSPAVAGVEGDGLLTMGEVLGLRLNADWVVLSACNTAASDGAGTEMLSGLGRAFFYAGARALLASNWPVETNSAKAITTSLFRHQRESLHITRAEALRRSMVGLMDGPGLADNKGRVVSSYAHPLFWAPFILVGDGAGTQRSPVPES